MGVKSPPPWTPLGSPALVLRFSRCNSWSPNCHFALPNPAWPFPAEGRAPLGGFSGRVHDDPESAARGWGHTGASPSNAAPPPHRTVRAPGSQPLPLSFPRVPRRDSESPSPTLTLASILPFPHPHKSRWPERARRKWRREAQQSRDPPCSGRGR